jgi:uncharacterized repeat protein (TIGR01451 family)
MKHNLFLRRRNFLLTLPILALTVLSMVLMITPGTAISAETGDVCIIHYGVAGCTAQDFGIKALNWVSTQTDCDAGNGFATATFDVVVATANPTRYDVGMFIALDGQSAATGHDCYHDFLNPVTPILADVNLTGGPWLSLDGDQCGDLASNSQATKRVKLTFKCVDTNSDNFVDINACASYVQNAKPNCFDVSVAVPGTSSKCGCNSFTTPIVMPKAPTPAVLVEKSVNPTTVMQGGSATFTVTVRNTGTVSIPATDITVADTTSPTSPVCTLSVPSESINTNNVLDVGETWTYTCTVDNLQPNSYTNTVSVTLTGQGPIETSASVLVQTPVITPAVVPTMTEWGMIIFIILAGAGSIYYLRRQRRTR